MIFKDQSNKIRSKASKKKKKTCQLFYKLFHNTTNLKNKHITTIILMMFIKKHLFDLETWSQRVRSNFLY